MDLVREDMEMVGAREGTKLTESHGEDFRTVAIPKKENPKKEKYYKLKCSAFEAKSFAHFCQQLIAWYSG